MEDVNTVILGIGIILFFIWRFVRTRQLYLRSSKNQIDKQDFSLFKPLKFHSFIKKAFLGKRCIKPFSFFIRAIVFLVVALCLLPFKNYEPILYWLIVALIIIYIPWCIVHGILLKKRIDALE